MISDSSALQQLSLLNREDEANSYHQSDTGYFSLLYGTTTGKNQKSYALADMPNVLAMVDPNRDTWMSQAEFTIPRRRVVNLARIGLLFADLDYYRMPDLQGLSAERMADRLLYFCHEHLSLPLPSIIVASGQGLQVKWLLKGTIPRRALPRWNACQKQLGSELEEFGSDPMARDAARVLRLVDTVNTKNGQLCQVVHVTKGDDGEPVRYDFEWLCEQLLPVARWDIEAQKQARQEKRAKLALVTTSNATKGLKKGSPRQVSWDRLEDLRRLAKLRGGVREGERMKTLHWHLNFLLLSGATNHVQMWYEATELANQIDKAWNHRSSELQTLYHKAKDYAAGKTVEFNGRQYPALYTPRNDTLINLFQITDDEIAQMQTIISSDEKKKRQASRDAARKGWKQTREEYEGQARKRREQAVKLRSQGFSYRYIAERLGCTVSEAHRFVNSVRSCPV